MPRAKAPGGALDFLYFERGLELLADRIAARDLVESEPAVAEVEHCLRYAWDYAAGRGSAADRFLGLLFDLDAEDVTLADVEALREAMRAWAVDQATAFGDAQRSAALRAREGKTRQANDRRARWQARADQIWRLAPRRKKDDVAGQIADEDGECSASYIAQQIRKPHRR